ncbi:hypothetical protein KSS87_013799 [Heliosperma pusillum]|nr:hypothetical protein KSS87_013799 [Heliosperma pusillum]
MSRVISVRKQVVEKSSKMFKDKEKTNQNKNNNYNLSRNLKKVYPLGTTIHRSKSLLSISPLTLSQTSTDSSLTDKSSSLDHKISVSLDSLRAIATTSPKRKELAPVEVVVAAVTVTASPKGCGGGEVKRCHWITKTSDKGYVSFHDQQWGAPVYDDK